MSSCSDFFKAASNGNFKEAEGVIKLPEQDSETFKYFVHWLYKGKLRGYYYPASVKPSIKQLEEEVHKILKDKFGADTNLRERHRLDADCIANRTLDYANYQDVPFTALVSLYILADQLQVRGLKDPVINELVDVYGYSSSLCRTPQNGIILPFWVHTQKNIDVDSEERAPWLPIPAVGINLAWNHLPERSKLRALLIELFCDNIHDNFDFQGLYNPDFMAEALRVMVGRWLGSTPVSDWAGDDAICGYHVHDVESLLTSTEI